MSKFWELLEESVIVQALVTLGMTAAIVYLALAGREVPEGLFGMATMALGYYFGSKAQLTGKQAARTVMKELGDGHTTRD